MGLIKSLIKIGAAGAVAGAVGSKIIKEAKKSESQRNHEYEAKTPAAKVTDYSAVLDVPLSKKKEIISFLKDKHESLNWNLIQTTKDSLLFQYGIYPKQELFIELKNINNKIHFNANIRVKNIGCYLSIADVNKFKEVGNEHAVEINKLFNTKITLRNNNTTKFCSGCGESLSKNAKFCEHCGNKL